MELSNIKPYPENEKHHPDEQVKFLAKLIKKFGWTQPIVVDENGMILLGHGRWMAWEQFGKQLDLPEPRIDVKEGLTDKEKTQLRVSDNKSNESAWDMPLIKTHLDDFTDEDLLLTGFTRNDLELFEPSDLEEQGDLDKMESKNLVCPECQYEGTKAEFEA